MRLQIISGNKVTQENIKAALHLDALYYPGDYLLSLDTCLGYFKSNNEIYFMAFDDKKLLAYFNFSPLDNPTFSTIEKGQASDMIISGDNVVTYKEGEDNNLYFSSIVVDRDYRHLGIADELIREMMGFLVEKAKKGIFVRRIMGDAITKEGEIILKKIGLSFVRTSVSGSKIYEGNLCPLTIKKTNLNEVLFDFYKKEGK